MKRIAAFGSALALALTLSLPAAAAERITFPDIQGHWAQATIEKWAAYGMVRGDAETHTFRPDDYLTRAEFAALIDRVIGYKGSGTTTYPDVDPQEWYAGSISRLGDAGVLQGYLNGTIRPNEDISRQEAAVVICRAFHIAPEEAHVHFSDHTWVGDWAEDYVGALYNRGVIQGYEGRFEPRHPITRSQAVTILDNLVGGVVSQTGVWSQNAARSLMVNCGEVTLQHITVGGDLWIGEGVDRGLVTLDNTRISGDIFLYSGGEDGLLLRGGTTLGGTLRVTAWVEGDIHITNESSQPVPALVIDQAEGEIYLEGDFDAVTVNCGAPVHLGKGTVKTLTVNAPELRVTVGKDCTLAKGELTAEAEGALLTVEGTVQELTVSAKAQVDNKGKLNTLLVKASGLILDGSRPSRLTVDKGVERPKDSKGNTIYGS